MQDLEARIVLESQDITERIPNGAHLAEKAVYQAGGALTLPGTYPPTYEIVKYASKLGY